MPKKERRNGAVTRQRVLESACATFADKGYRDATVAEICHKAEANIAAVNYHFGDKETLYVKALQYAFRIATERYPIDGRLGPETAPEQRLRVYVQAHLRRIFSDDESSHFPRMVVKEMAEPTQVPGSVIREVLKPHREHLRGVLNDLLGGDVDGEAVRFCVLSIISQCYFFGFNKAFRQRHFESGKMTEERLQRLIDHITQFCLAGIRDVRTRMGKDDKPS